MNPNLLGQALHGPTTPGRAVKVPEQSAATSSLLEQGEHSVRILLPVGVVRALSAADEIICININKMMCIYNLEDLILVVGKTEFSHNNFSPCLPPEISNVVKLLLIEAEHLVHIVRLLWLCLLCVNMCVPHHLTVGFVSQCFVLELHPPEQKLQMTN